MLKLLTLLCLWTAACTGTKQVPPADLSSPGAALLEKRLVLEASDMATAQQALATIYAFVHPTFAQITEQSSGTCLLHSDFSIFYPARYNIMIEQVAELPGVRILQRN